MKSRGKIHQWRSLSGKPSLKVHAIITREHRQPSDEDGTENYSPSTWRAGHFTRDDSIPPKALTALAPRTSGKPASIAETLASTGGRSRQMAADTGVEQKSQQSAAKKESGSPRLIKIDNARSSLLPRKGALGGANHASDNKNERNTNHHPAPRLGPVAMHFRKHESRQWPAMSIAAEIKAQKLNHDSRWPRISAQHNGKRGCKR